MNNDNNLEFCIAGVNCRAGYATECSRCSRLCQETASRYLQGSSYWSRLEKRTIIIPTGEKDYYLTKTIHVPSVLKGEGQGQI